MHNTEGCIHLKDVIEILMRDKHLKEYTKKRDDARPEAQETKNVKEKTLAEDWFMPVALSITHPEDFYVPEEVAFPTYLVTHSPWESFHSAMVISGGGGSEMTVRSIKRKFNELITTTSAKNSTLDMG